MFCVNEHDSLTDLNFYRSNDIVFQQRHKFSQEEDIKLNKLVSLYGPRKWDQIALSMPGRSGRQCRDRFHNYLNPSLVNGPWTKEEDELLEKKVYELGQHWNKIVKVFKGRSTNNIKNRWYTYICKQKRNQNIFTGSQIFQYQTSRTNNDNIYDLYKDNNESNKSNCQFRACRI